MQGRPIKTVLVVLAMSVGLAGCGPTKPHVYDPKNSEALNFARAGKVRAVQDFDLTQGQIDSIAQDWESVTSKDYRPRQQTESNLLFAWVPVEMVDSSDDASKVFSGAVTGAIEDALFELKIPHTVEYTSVHTQLAGFYDYLYSSVSIVDSNIGCPTWQQASENLDKKCGIQSIVVSPNPGKAFAPESLESNGIAYAFFASEDLEYSELDLQFAEGSQLDRYKILTRISVNLPSWAFIYAPGVRVANGEFTVPLVFNQGIAYPFKRP